MSTVNFDDLKAQAAQHIGAYAALLHPQWAPNWHHRVIASVLDRVADKDPEYRRLCIELPPRMGKSSLISSLLPGWYLAQYPHETFILSTYGKDLTEKMGREARGYADSELFRTLFDLSIKKDTNAITNWQLTNGAGYFGTTVGSAMTGFGANISVVDDPIKNSEEAASKGAKDRIWDWFLSVPMTRLEKNATVIVVQTRWAEDDLIGRILQQDEEKEWKRISFPMIATQDEMYRKKDEPLWPEKSDLAQCLKIKKQVGRRVWASLYQQEPRPDDGVIFLEQYLRWYRQRDLADLYFSAVYQSWDTGVSKKGTSARSCCTTWGAVHDENVPGGTKFYLLQAYAEVLNFPELRNKARELVNEFEPDVVWVEEQQTGRPLIDELKLSLSGVARMQAVRPKGDKEARAKAISSVFEAGRVFLPSDANWAESYVEELLAFPYGQFMDQVDSTTQAIRQMVKEEYKGRRKSPVAPWRAKAAVPVSIYGR